MIRTLFVKDTQQLHQTRTFSDCNTTRYVYVHAWKCLHKQAKEEAMRRPNVVMWHQMTLEHPPSYEPISIVCPFWRPFHPNKSVCNTHSTAFDGNFLSVFLYVLAVRQQNTPVTDLDRPWGFQDVEIPRFQDSRHMKVVRLPALRTSCLYPRKYSWYSFLLEAESTPGP